MGHVVLVVALLLVGGALLAVGTAGWAGRLPRNRFAGVRTPASMGSDQAFAAANRVAGPVVTAAGGVAVLGGLFAIGLDGAALVVVTVIAAVGALVLLLAGGALGDRAAAATAAVPADSACAGCVCGSGGCAALSG